MPLGKFFRRNKQSQPQMGSSPPLSDKERKALFGLKVVQAQQNPEPIYDLSGCSAPWLPDDTFTFCKLLGKTTLNVKFNNLSSLDSGGSFEDLSELIVLDASNNKIYKIPDSIMYMKKLQILNLSDNMLKSLPDSICYLNNLEELYLYKNKFSKVPHSICALQRLRVLDLKDNIITYIPNELCNLQHSLCIFKFDESKIKNLPKEVFEEVEEIKGIMIYLCQLAGVEYEGLKINSYAYTQSPITNAQTDAFPISEVDHIMLAYMRRKDEQLKLQILEEEKMQAREKEQLQSILQDTSANKEEILRGLPSASSNVIEFEDEKQRKLLGHIQLEEKFRNEQEVQLDIYLTNTSDKESLLHNISAQEDLLKRDVEIIVQAKERERAKLVLELSRAEEDTASALDELLNIHQSQKSSDFATLIIEQEDEIIKIVTGLVEYSTELRQADIVKAMQSQLTKEAIAEAQREQVEEKQKSWVNALLKEGEIEQCYLEDLMNNKAADQEIFVTNLLEQEKFQEQAFRLLLEDMDLKRNSVVRQITLVEFELIRLTSLELKKKMCDIEDSSSKMLEQRKLLVDLLCSLFQEKDNRDKELENWVYELAIRKGSSKKSTEDFWLVQYQQLMNMKPAGLIEAEEKLDPEVHEILKKSHALDLLPVFAKHAITFTRLLEMTEDDFNEINIGTATFHGIQRSIHTYLNKSKLGLCEPSAPEVDFSCFPSAPEVEPHSPPVLNIEASAPLLENQFIESECVVCLNNNSQVLFLPCGHVCVCSVCCIKLSICPLCRSDISNKCFINP